MAQQIQLRRGSSALWTSTDPILAQGEVAIELDTNRSKIGNGIDIWSLLPYAFESSGVPLGGIIMWSGAIAAIPSPFWELCDGILNAPGPDLRDKFIVGATSDDAGVAKSNVEGSLQQSGGMSSHSHSAHADHSIASVSGTTPAITLTHGDHSVPSLSHQPIGTHIGTDYGIHTITQPADHGVAGTLTHSFAEPNDHVVSAHDSVSNLNPYFALAFIQRMIRTRWAQY